MSDTTVTPRPWLWKVRTRPIRLVQIHATRSGQPNFTDAQERSATLNWVQSDNNNQGGWGGAFNFLITGSGDMDTVLRLDKLPQHAAGYGSTIYDGGAVDDWGPAFEFTQPVATRPFTDAHYRRGAKEIAPICVANSIPPVFVTWLDQRQPPPTGLIRHDRCENGKKLGKSDPGPQWNEGLFTDYLKQEIAALEGDWFDMATREDLSAAIAEWVRSAEYGNILRAAVQDELAPFLKWVAAAEHGVEPEYVGKNWRDEMLMRMRKVDAGQ